MRLNLNYKTYSCNYAKIQLKSHREIGLAMSRNVLLTLLVISLGALLTLAVLRWNAPLPGVEQKGTEWSLTAEYVSLATAVVSMVTAIVGLVRSTRKSSHGDT